MRDLFQPEYPNLSHAKKLDVLRLIRSENIGPITFFKLFSHFGSVSAALDAIPEMSVKGGRKKPIAIASQTDAERELEAVEKFGATFIAYGDEHYPLMLQTIHDPPPLLTVLGHPRTWQKQLNVAVVGARNASANGCRFTHQIAMDLGKGGATVVSGLARGVDAAAHQGALSSGTVGVIAGGIDTVYPPENANLYKQIAEQGAILSEQPFNASPQPRNFPARNRIISGMSHGIVVVEASLKSGSLITARMAMEQGREVFAVPGSPMDPRCKGTNQLLREGASIAETAEEVLRGLSSFTKRPFAEAKLPEYESPAHVTPDARELTRARALVLEKLGLEAVLVDELITQCQLTAGTVLTVLLELELAGRLHRYPGNRVSLAFA